jgi:isopenicillin N synthase-like dioxygenase
VLELEDEEYFVNRHRYEAPGLEYLRYMKYHPSENLLWAIGHTNYNTLTFLFHQPISGLQVQTKEGWRYGMASTQERMAWVGLTADILNSSFQPRPNHSKRRRRP